MVRRVRARKTRDVVTRPELLKWLDTITCTRPFSIADAAELKAMINGALPGVKVDVYSPRGDVVHVQLDGVTVRNISVV